MNYFRSVARLRSIPRAPIFGGEYSAFTTVSLIALNQLMNIGATTGFAISGRGETFKTFLLWQIVGSAFGLGTQLTFAGLVRVSSVQLASAVGIGLAFVSAEVFSAYGIFRESFSLAQWLGVGLVFMGIMLLVLGRT